MSLSPEQLEYAEMLLRRAQGDLGACRALADDAEIDDSIIGFHSQQAVEKSLKMVLVLSDVELPYTHDLDFLVRQVQRAGVDLPGGLANVEWLSPWAAALRYDEPEPLDRPAALFVASSATEWAGSLFAEQAAGGQPQGSFLSRPHTTEPDKTSKDTDDPTTPGPSETAS